MLKDFFAKRTAWDFDANPLIVHLEALRRKEIAVLDLTESNPTRCGFQYPAEEIIQQLTHPKNISYQPNPCGILQAREAVCAYYRRKNLKVEAERVLLASSTSEAYSLLFRLLVNPGERVLIPSPSYPLFELLAQLNDVELDRYPLKYEHAQWSIDLVALEEVIQENTKAILLVHPNNPTGSYIKRDELVEINRLCQKHGLAIICDEVFNDYFFEEKADRLYSLVENDAALTFVLGGISKSLALPQMKIAWVAVNGPEELVQVSRQKLEVLLDTYLSVSTPAQNALPGWLELREVIQKEILQRLKQNLAFLKDQLASAAGCQMLEAEGGWYAVIRLPEYLDEDQWVWEFLDADHVFTHPGYFFDFHDEPFVVLSLLPPAEIFQEGVKRILKRIYSFGDGRNPRR